MYRLLQINYILIITSISLSFFVIKPVCSKVQKKCFPEKFNNTFKNEDFEEEKEYPEVHVTKIVPLYRTTPYFTSKYLGESPVPKNWTVRRAQDGMIVIPSMLDFLRFECTASYRVQWGFQSFPWITWDTWTTAIRPRYKNQSVIYSATIEFHKVQETSLQSRIPICYSSKEPCIQTAVVPHSSPPNLVEINFERASKYGIDSETDKEQFGTNLNCTLKFGYDPETEKFYCQETDPETKTSGKIFLRPCQDAVTCSSLVSQSGCKAEKIIPISECTIANRCRKETSFAGKFPGIAVCHSGRLPEHSAVIPYFSSVAVNSSTNRTTRYLNWNDVNPTLMLEMPEFQEPVYTHQKISLICNASYFYLGSGMYFELTKVSNLSAIGGNATDNDDGTTDFNGLEHEKSQLDVAEERVISEEANIGGIGTKLPVIRSLEVNNFDFQTVGKFKLSCNAPIWNQTGWAVKSIELEVKESIPPEIEGGNSTVKQYYSPQRRLECVAFGVPKPELVWTRDGAPVPTEITLITGEQNQTLVWAILVFPKMEYGISGNFTCQASNVAGFQRKSFLIILPDKNSSIAVYILIGLALLISILIPLILLLCWKVKKQRKMLIGLTQEEIDEFLNGRPEYIPFQCDMSTYAYYLPYDKSYEIPRESLEIDLEKILGSGEYGLVLYGMYKNPNPAGGVPIPKAVAVKTTKPLTSGKEHFKALLSELKIMTYIGSHDNIVNLVGACTANIGKREVYIAIEYCENGSLLTYLRTNRYALENPSFYTELAPVPHSRLSSGMEETSFINPYFANLVKEGVISSGISPDIQYVKMEDLNNIVINPQYENIRWIKQHNLILWSYEIAAGMEFLSRKKVIHGDLAARNVLLTRDLTAKIGDFGLSRQLYHYTYYTKTAGTPLPLKWLAIECLQNFQFSIESDVWAYGVTLFEIFSIGEIPYKSVQMNGEEFLQALKHGLRLSKPAYAPVDIFDLMMKCWRHEKKSRPSFTDIVKFMKSKVDNLNRRSDSLISGSTGLTGHMTDSNSSPPEVPKRAENTAPVVVLRKTSVHNYANLPAINE